MLLYGLGWYTPFFRIVYEVVPGVSFYRRPADAVFLIGGLGSIVAGYALHRLLAAPYGERSHGAVAATVGGVVALMAVCLLVAWRLDRVGPAVVPLAMALGSFAVVLAAVAGASAIRHIRPVAALALIGGVTAGDLAWNNGPNGASGLLPDMVEMLEPDTKNETVALLKRLVAEGRSEIRRDRVELVGLGFHWPNASLTHGLENTLGYNPVRLGIYSAATGAEDHSGLVDQRKFSSLMPGYNSRLADMLGLRWIASGVPIEQLDKRAKAGEFRLVARTRDGYVYENPRAMPRVMFARRAAPVASDQLIASGVWPTFEPSDTVLIDDAMMPSGWITAGARMLPPGQVRIVRTANTEVVVEAESSAGGWVVLNDVWHPRWEVEVDGRHAGQALRANAIFRAALVPPGKVRVRFVFRPLSGSWRMPERHGALPDGFSADMRRADVQQVCCSATLSCCCFSTGCN